MKISLKEITESNNTPVTVYVDGYDDYLNIPVCDEKEYIITALATGAEIVAKKDYISLGKCKYAFKYDRDYFIAFKSRFNKLDKSKYIRAHVLKNALQKDLKIELLYTRTKNPSCTILIKDTK